MTPPALAPWWEERADKANAYIPKHNLPTSDIALIEAVAEVRRLRRTPAPDAVREAVVKTGIPPYPQTMSTSYCPKHKRKGHDRTGFRCICAELEIAWILGAGSTAIRAEDVIEKLAAVEHERWAGWMRYLFSKCVGSNFAILPIYVSRWKTQMDTPYAELSEAEKESDRIEVRKTLAALQPPAPASEKKP